MDKSASLTPEILHIVNDKGTEMPMANEYNEHMVKGTYLCRQCGLALFRSTNKFLSSCGWPSFDDEIANTIKRDTDADGRRTEILCQRCNAHLGHVFHGEYITEKNTRHCVNSLAIDFVTDTEVVDSEEAIYAGGCFWGVEALLKQQDGVLKTEVGYTGGHVDHPSYERICSGTTEHVEAIRVIYDPTRINYITLTKLFFEIHNPLQADGQGPDRGSQYLSKIFYYDTKQKEIIANLITQLEQQGLSIATQVEPVATFWPAEDYHQDYYAKTGNAPYCHRYVKRFED